MGWTGAGETGYPVWRQSLGPVEVRFVGRGANGGRGSREEILAGVESDPPELAWARQVHSARVLVAQPGECGEGDALFTRRSGLALSVVTADCVPVLLAGPEGIAAVHAGWRGIASGVIAAAVAALGSPAETAAWIGPAIGLCCYEVGEDVAAEVAAASAPDVVIKGPVGRPHLDLPGAAWRQLQSAGVQDVRCVIRCTRCDAERLASYRREGKGAGRNLAVIWRRG